MYIGVVNEIGICIRTGMILLIGNMMDIEMRMEGRFR